VSTLDTDRKRFTTAGAGTRTGAGAGTAKDNSSILPSDPRDGGNGGDGSASKNGLLAMAGAIAGVLANKGTAALLSPT
jgi:hypothetical protein